MLHNPNNKKPKKSKDNERHYPKATLPWTNPKWESYQANASKGETKALVDHARKIFGKGNQNTSIDAPWNVYKHWSLSDFYTILIMILALAPCMLLFWIPMFAALFPPVLLNRLYIGWRVPTPSNTLPRNTCDWYIHCFLQFILCLPALFLAVLVLWYSYIVMAIFGIIYLIPSTLLKCQLPTTRVFKNLAVLRPYQGGPSLLWHFPDCVVAVAGSVYRQHFLEFMFGFTNMFFVNPWLKYWLTANVYVEDLGERFITQIGQSMADMSLEDIDTQVIKAISRSKHTNANRNEIDAKSFAPHYPYPPGGNNRRYAIGMQHTKSITNLVHTTHFRSPSSGKDDDAVASLSTSAALPVYRVILWRNNPYHIYTGFVEANISTGQPSQPSKLFGGEHPMWLINSHNKLAADRNVSMSLGNIDNFFDDYIPQLAHFIRMNVRGKKIADEYLANDKRQGYETASSQQYRKMAEI